MIDFFPTRAQVIILVIYCYIHSYFLQLAALIRSPVKSPSHSSTPQAHGKGIVIEHSEMPSEVPVRVLLQMAKAKKKKTAQKKDLLSQEKDFSAAKPQQSIMC